MNDPFLSDILSEQDKRPTPFRIVPIKNPEKLETHLQFVAQMAKAVDKANPVKRPVSTIQEPSTQRLMDMTEEELAAYKARPLPGIDAWKREDDAELLWSQHKGNTPENIVAVLGTRVARNDDGKDPIIGPSPERREAAEKAWMETKPSDYSAVEKYFIANGHIKNDPTPKKDSWWTKFAMWRAKVFQGDTDSTIRWRDVQKDSK